MFNVLTGSNIQISLKITIISGGMVNDATITKYVSLGSANIKEPVLFRNYSNRFT